MKKFLNESILFYVFSIIVCIIPSCKEDIHTEEIVFPDSGVSYIKHVEPLFFNTCAFTGCHGEDTFEERGFSLDSYQNAIAKPGIIIPGEPEHSILVQRIGIGSGFVRMPLNRQPLNENQINGIKTWIREGARPD